MRRAATLNFFLAATALARFGMAEPPAADQAPAPKALPARTLRLPDLKIGIVYAHPQESTANKGWRQLGPAKGMVVIPAGHEAKLEINLCGDIHVHSTIYPTGMQVIEGSEWAKIGGGAPMDALACLGAFGADDIQELNLSAPNLGVDDLAPLAKLAGLKSLSIESELIRGNALAHLNGLSNLESLAIESRIDSIGLDRLNPPSSLKSIYLPTEGREDLVAILDRAPWVEAVRLPDAVGDAGMIHLRGLRNLRTLDLSRQEKITDAGLASLSELATLESLWLPPRATDAGLAALARLDRLQRLDLPRGITDAGIVHLKELKKLQSLEMREGQVSGVGLRILAALPNLRSMHLADCRIEPEDLDALKGATALRSLDLANNPIGDEGLRRLAGLESLEHIKLTHTGVTSEGLVYLRGMKGLKLLWLWGNPIFDGGLERLTGLKELRFVNLGTTQITDQGAQRLLALPALHCAILPPQISAALLAQFAAKLPGCRITIDPPSIGLPTAPAPVPRLKPIS